MAAENSGEAPATEMKPILVVDDEPSIAQIASDYLRHGGFGVITASNGADALALARAQRPDLIVLDLGLPRVDGLVAPGAPGPGGGRGKGRSSCSPPQSRSRTGWPASSSARTTT